MSAAHNRHIARPTDRRFAGAVLLVLAVVTLLGGAEPHLGHGAARAEMPVFVEASHAGQADHWDAARSEPGRRCPDCLAPPQPLEPAPVGASRLTRAGAGDALPGETSGPTDPGSRRSQRSRAPPPS